MNANWEKSELDRRQLVGAAAVTAAAGQLGMFSAVAVLQTAQAASEPERKADIDFLEVDQDITLRRLVVRHPRSKGTVLFLHGFPETLYAWNDISLALADDYEVHAFNWPGYGLSSQIAAVFWETSSPT